MARNPIWNKSTFVEWVNRHGDHVVLGDRYENMASPYANFLESQGVDIDWISPDTVEYMDKQQRFRVKRTEDWLRRFFLRLASDTSRHSGIKALTVKRMLAEV